MKTDLYSKLYVSDIKKNKQTQTQVNPALIRVLSFCLKYYFHNKFNNKCHVFIVVVCFVFIGRLIFLKGQTLRAFVDVL